MDFTPTFLLWAPIALLFLSAIVGIMIERHTKDPCLKTFDGDFVILRMKNGQFLWGTVRVFPDCLELLYLDPVPIGQNRTKTSYVLYNKKVAEIDRIYRPAPAPDSPAFVAWTREIEALRHPGIGRRLARLLRNTYGMLRDAFSQSLGMALGIFRQRSKSFQQLGTAEKHANEVGQSLLKILPHAYEPVLETYRGSFVVVESMRGTEIEESLGVLDDYSVAYLLTRGVQVEPAALPAELAGRPLAACDVIFPRGLSIVRHRVTET